jgi:hypothetical protein
MRPKKLECRNCVWWAVLSKAGGRCHRNPPAMNQRTGRAEFPRTGPKDWCGEHELAAVDETVDDETKDD